MEENSKISEQTIYHKFAEQYQGTKRRSIMNLLNCGRILHEAKDAMAHGMFMSFLEDTRVSESTRTAHRLMAIYKNYRHLLNNPDIKAKAISQLGVSHLLELQKLPERFKKQIEVVKEIQGKEIRELVNVVDEEKLADFLDKPVNVDGEQRLIRDLPLTEMKKYIREAQGIYDPEEPVTEPEDDEKVIIDLEKNQEGVEHLPKMKPSSEVEVVGVAPDAFGEIMGDLAKLSGTFLRLNETLHKIDKVFISELPDVHAQVMIQKLGRNAQYAAEFHEKVTQALERLKEDVKVQEVQGSGATD